MNRYVPSVSRCLIPDWLSSLLLGIVLALSWTANADAATVVYLQWSDSTISGPGPLGAIELTSYSQSDSNPVNLAAGAGGTGKSTRPTCGQITIMKQLDNTSPEFLAKVFEGSLTNSTVPVTINFEKLSGPNASFFKFYRVQLYEVAVTSVTQSDTQDGLINETIMLEARRFRFLYTPQKPDGTGGTTVSFGWDCVSNRQF